MNSVFIKYLGKFVLVFLDDIIVYSKNEEECKEYLTMALQVFRKHKLYVKLNKCGFYKKWIQYLGHVILEEEIIVDQKKIEAIMDWPTPKNVMDFISFMGFVGYYRRFIEVFSKITHPITSLQRKNVKFN